MSQRYESVYIFKSALEEPQVNERLERYHALLGGSDAVENVSHWGKRTLAYPIDGHTAGYYVVVQFAAAAARLTEYERALKLDEDLLRHLLVVNELPVGVAVPAGDGGDAPPVVSEEETEPDQEDA